MNDTTQHIDVYVHEVSKLKSRIADMSPDQLRTRPLPGRWSTLEVVCHIVDSDSVLADRMKRIIAEEQPTLPYAHEGPWVERLCCHERDIEEELSLLELTRSQMARILKAIPEESFTRTGFHTMEGSFTLAGILERGMHHITHHLKFIDEKRAVLELPAVQ